MANYLFIDGEYLRRRFEHQMNAFYGEVPPIAFLEIKLYAQATRAYYYDAVNYQQESGESEEECKQRVATREALHDHISGVPGFFVREGEVRRTRRRRNRDSPEQKAVDVQLAVDAFEHGVLGNMEWAVLFAGDLDFEPLLTALERHGVKTRLLFVPQCVSEELQRAADETRQITLEHFWSWTVTNFRANHPQMRFFPNQQRPSRDAWDVCREGRFNNRAAVLLKPRHNAAARLWVEPDQNGWEPSWTLEYADIDKLPLAFELTYGKIDWQ